MLKQVTLHSGRIVKMGRRRPVAQGPRLHLKNYIDKAHLPEVPKTFSYAPRHDQRSHRCTTTMCGEIA
jgi:hypothetical protein